MNKIMLTFIIGIVVVGLGIFGGAKMAGKTTDDINNKVKSMTEKTTTGDKIKLETNHGNIIIELYTDEMSLTTGNFRKLVEEGVYDGVIFHRIIDGFMIQGGDPTGTGMGDPNIPDIKDEFTQTSLDRNDRYTIAMANAGPNTGSSQFFINLVNNNFLDGKHPVFGKVVDGKEVVDKIAKVETNSQDKPVKDVIIVKASLI